LETEVTNSRADGCPLSPEERKANGDERTPQAEAPGRQRRLVENDNAIDLPLIVSLYIDPQA
jgi:hypothetical protein